MERQGLSLRGTQFVITLGVGIGSLLSVIAGLQQLTTYWWVGLYALLSAGMLRVAYSPYQAENMEDEIE